MISFSPSRGHEQRGYRPALVISSDAFNRYTHFAVLCPITSSIGDYPLNINLDDRTKINGAILCGQIKTADMDARNWKYVEKAPDDIMEKVTDIILSELTE